MLSDKNKYLDYGHLAFLATLVISFIVYNIGNTKSNGAVPEPHEWALIILVLLSITYVKLRPKWNKVNA